jgi:hypothetical protein
MSNYTQTTNFATKDALASGNPLKIVKGTEINVEFANIATAIATKTDSGILGADQGGTGVANNSAMTVTGSGNFAYTRTLTAATNVTFPTTGTLSTLAGSETFTNKTLTSPALTSPVISGTPTGVGVLTSGTAVTLTTQTSVDFTSIPSWVKRITVNFQGTSLSATANILVQLGTGSTSYTTSGYISTSVACQAAGNTVTSSTAGFVLIDASAAGIISGRLIITNISGNNWVSSHTAKRDTTTLLFGAGDISLGAVLTAVRITSTSTDTFDAGSINILYE